MNWASGVAMQAAKTVQTYTPRKQQSPPAIVLILFVIVFAALAFGAWTYLLNQQTEFWKMHDVLYGWKPGTNADQFPLELVKTLSLGLRLNPREFDSCVRDPASITPVEDGLRDGFAIGVWTLPAVYVNGVYVDGIADSVCLSALVLNACDQVAPPHCKTDGEALPPHFS